MKAPSTRLTTDHDTRPARDGGRVVVDTQATVQRDDAERVQSTHDLQTGLHVTDVSDTMPIDLIDQLFRPPGKAA